jgi:hypothetical protein
MFEEATLAMQSSALIWMGKNEKDIHATCLRRAEKIESVLYQSLSITNDQFSERLTKNKSFSIKS